MSLLHSWEKKRGGGRRLWAPSFHVSAAPGFAILPSACNNGFSSQDGDVGRRDKLPCLPIGPLAGGQPVWADQHPVTRLTVEIPLTSDGAVVLTCKHKVISINRQTFRTMVDCADPFNWIHTYRSVQLHPHPNSFSKLCHPNVAHRPRLIVPYCNICSFCQPIRQHVFTTSLIIIHKDL